MRASPGPSPNRIECSTEDYGRGRSLDTATARTRELPVCAPRCAHTDVYVPLWAISSEPCSSATVRPNTGKDLGLGDLVEGNELGDGVLEAIPAGDEATREGCLNSGTLDVWYGIHALRPSPQELETISPSAHGKKPHVGIASSPEYAFSRDLEHPRRTRGGQLSRARGDRAGARGVAGCRVPRRLRGSRLAPCGRRRARAGRRRHRHPDAADRDRRGHPLAAELRSTHPDVGVVVLSQHADPVYATTLFQDGSRGRAYLLKERVRHPGDLNRAVREVSIGGSVVDARIVEELLGAGRKAEEPAARRLDAAGVRDSRADRRRVEQRGDRRAARDHEARGRGSCPCDLLVARSRRRARRQPTRACRFDVSRRSKRHEIALLSRAFVPLG